MSGWILFSEYLISIKSELSNWQYDLWKKVDLPISLTLMMTTFLTFIVDIIANMNVIRVLFAMPFTRRQLYLVIILKTDKEFEIPVRNKQEVNTIIHYVQSP
jgi:hypothetical protein